MRKSVLWKGIHVRLSLTVCIALLVSLAIAGCGGGGGGGNNGGNNGGNGGNNNPPPNGSLAVVSGTVQDTNGSPVTGATVSIVGTSLSAQSGSDGKFQINNVPLTATSFQVTSPSLSKYFNAGFYNGSQFNFGTDSQACVMALPPLKAASQGPSPLPSVIQFYISSGSAPPPPPLVNPPAGCPKLH